MSMKKENEGLDILKEHYSVLQSKYALPDFQYLNENFDIESLASNETEMPLKKIRKQITEKVSSGLRALEMFLNPQNAPLFIFTIIKSFSQTDKEIINEVYHQFAEFEIEAFGLETVYSEKKEAEFIKKVCVSWKDISADFNRIYDSMKVNFRKESKKQEKSYFG